MSNLGKEEGMHHIFYVSDFSFSSSQPPSWFICGNLFLHRWIINPRSYNSIFQVSESVYYRANYFLVN